MISVDKKLLQDAKDNIGGVAASEYTHSSFERCYKIGWIIARGETLLVITKKGREALARENVPAPSVRELVESESRGDTIGDGEAVLFASGR